MTDEKRGIVIKWLFGDDPAVAEEGCGRPADRQRRDCLDLKSLIEQEK
jgi:hypothetical protein